MDRGTGRGVFVTNQLALRKIRGILERPNGGSEFNLNVPLEIDPAALALKLEELQLGGASDA
jgi:hypothetical protein